MAEQLQTNWIVLVVALLVGVLVAWWIFARSRRTRVEFDPTDDTAGPARRNQALIDAPGLTTTQASPPPTPAGLAGAGEAVAAAVAPAPLVPDGDDLTRIKGLGPKLAQELRALGVTGLSDIAAWTEADIDRIDARLGRFQGRIRRDDWPRQARLLAEGDNAAYSKEFGNQ